MNEIREVTSVLAVLCIVGAFWVTFHKHYLTAYVACIVGLVAALISSAMACAIMPVNTTSLSVSIPLAAILSAMTVWIRERRRQVMAGPLSRGLLESDLTMKSDAYERDVVCTCWHCGASDAPLCIVPLAKLHIVLFVGRKESVEVLIPLCLAHSRNANFAAQWIRTLALPGGMIIGFGL